MPVNGDTLDEPDETLHRRPLQRRQRDDRRRAPAPARSPTTTPPPALSIDDVTVDRGQRGTTTATFTVTLSRAERPARVTRRLRDRRRHRRRSRRDYTHDAAARSPSPPARRPRPSPSPSRATRSTSPTRPSPSTSRPGQRDDRRRPGHRHDHRRRRRAVARRSTTSRVTEGNAGHDQRDLHRHARRRASGKTVTVDYATADGTRRRSPPTTPRPRGTLTFAPGQTTQDRHRPRQRRHARRARRDLQRRPLERRSTRRSATPPAPARSPTTTRPVSAVDRRRDRHRGQPGTTNAVFTVTLSAPPAARRSRSTTRPPTARATQPGRLHRSASGTLTFAPGQTTQDDHRPRQRRHARRAERDASRVSLSNAAQRDARRRRPAPARSPTTTPPPTLSISDVAVDRGQRRDDERRLHRHARRRQRQHGHRRLRDRRRHRDASPATTRRPAARSRSRPGQTTQDDHRPGQRRHARRGRRDVPRRTCRNPTNATIADGQGDGTITDDDPRVVARDQRRRRHRGQRRDGERRPSPSRCRRRQRQDRHRRLRDRRRHRARSPARLHQASGTLTFAPGETTKTVTVPSSATRSTRPTRRSSSTSRARPTRRSPTPAAPARSPTTTRRRRCRSTT